MNKILMTDGMDKRIKENLCMIFNSTQRKINKEIERNKKDITNGKFP